MKDFAKIITEQRKQQKMTQEELANLLGITPQAVSKWENGVGLPDVTLFPSLAKALDISLEKLFGIEKKAVAGEIPESFQGLPRVAQFGGKVCYSDKELLKTEEGTAFFADGSSADFQSGTVTNCGKGEIRIVCIQNETEEDFAALDRGEDYEELLGDFDSLSVTAFQSCDVQILRAEDGNARLHASGSREFVGIVRTKLDGRHLKVNVGDPRHQSKRSHCNDCLKIYVRDDGRERLDLTINGAGGMTVEPDFQSGSLSINGSGDITAKSFGKLNVQIAGSGDVRVSEISESAKMSIMGSGDIIAASVANPSVKVMGSGDVTLKRVSGNMNLQIMGSGDVTCAGELEKLTVNISGSGDFDGSKLSATDADLKLSSGAEVKLERIKRQSVEKLEQGSTLEVLRRG